MNRLFLISLIGLAFASCSDRLDEPHDNGTESVNGFSVTWRSQITERQKETVVEILNDMILVEGDVFSMGAYPEQEGMARPNETPNSYIRLSDYYICAHEVSDDQFNAIMGTDVHGGKMSASHISLSQWHEFIDRLRDLSGINFNLPSEAQWEYAARGGKYSQYYIYPGSNDLEEVRSTSHVEGSLVPNELGIYNLADLKSEWCRDRYGELIPDRLLTDWVQTEGKNYVVRGGNFKCTITSDKYYPKTHYTNTAAYRLTYGATISKPELDYRHCRITSRSYYYDDERLRPDEIGCRLVVNPR